MNRLTQEWYDYAERDLSSALLQLAAPGHPHHAAVCFFAQQCVEELMKAVLTMHLIRFEKTHDLHVLSSLITERVDSRWTADSRDLDKLNAGAVRYRYPGEKEAGADESKASIDACRRVRSLILPLLGVEEK